MKKDKAFFPASFTEGPSQEAQVHSKSETSCLPQLPFFLLACLCLRPAHSEEGGFPG